MLCEKPPRKLPVFPTLLPDQQKMTAAEEIQQILLGVEEPVIHHEIAQMPFAAPTGDGTGGIAGEFADVCCGEKIRLPGKFQFA